MITTGIEARHRAYARLQSEEPRRHSFAYGGNDFLMAIISCLMANNPLAMANIQLAMAEIRSCYGGNYVPAWRILFRYGENSPESDFECRELSLLGGGCFLGQASCLNPRELSRRPLAIIKCKASQP